MAVNYIIAILDWYHIPPIRGTKPSPVQFSLNQTSHKTVVSYKFTTPKKAIAEYFNLT